MRKRELAGASEETEERCRGGGKEGMATAGCERQHEKGIEGRDRVSIRKPVEWQKVTSRIRTCALREEMILYLNCIRSNQPS